LRGSSNVTGTNSALRAVPAKQAATVQVVIFIFETEGNDKWFDGTLITLWRRGSR
jgi:hypothetical protein